MESDTDTLGNPLPGGPLQGNLKPSPGKFKLTYYTNGEERFPGRLTKHEGVGTQNHYTAHGIEPIDYIVQNNMNFLEGNIIKYVTRYKLKNGLEDLKKAQQYLTWLIEDNTLDIEADDDDADHRPG